MNEELSFVFVFVFFCFFWGGWGGAEGEVSSLSFALLCNS